MSFYSKFRLDIKISYFRYYWKVRAADKISCFTGKIFHSCKIFNSSLMTALPDDFLVISLNTDSNDQLRCPKA